MAKREDSLTLTQLATRIPKDLHRVVKVFCVNHDTSVADFTADALRHELEQRQAEERERPAKATTKAAKEKTKQKTKVFDDDDQPDYDDDENAA